VCLCVVIAEEREGKLVTRTVSMPSVRVKGMPLYMKTQSPLSENEEEPTGEWEGAGHRREGKKEQEREGAGRREGSSGMEGREG